MRPIRVKLDLGDAGWRRIDDASIRVYGEVNEVIVRMQRILEDQPVKELCRNLGILSSGFLFYDKLGEKTRFYDPASQEHPQTYRTSYVWRNNRAKANWADLVHWLFVRVRIDQYKQAKIAGFRTEDYFVHLPVGGRARTRIPNRAAPALNRLGIHYCTLGEMLFTIFAWRCLSVAAAMGYGSCKLEKLDVKLNDGAGAGSTCSWQGADLLSENEICGLHSTDVRHELRRLWGRKIGPQKNWSAEWRHLRIWKSRADDTSVERTALIRFAAALGAIHPLSSALTSTNDELNGALQRGVPLLLKALGCPKPPNSISDAINTIERFARFPILPFYIWQVLDQSPKCYFVSPVWTSQLHAVDIESGRKCRHLGLAISATAPLKRLDWTVPRVARPIGKSVDSKADPLVIVNVLRLMARPLVEGHLYEKVVAEVALALHEKAEAKIAEIVRKSSNRAILSA